MSKRFGRNQKRELNNELAAYKAQLLKDQSTLVELRKERRYLEAQIRGLAEEVTRYFGEEISKVLMKGITKGVMR